MVSAPQEQQQETFQETLGLAVRKPGLWDHTLLRRYSNEIFSLEGSPKDQRGHRRQ
jgi:hypothetical protein